MKIFIGLTDIANIEDIYARAFRELGHETVTMVWKRNRFYPSTQYDIVLQEQASASAPAGWRAKDWRGKIKGAFTRLSAIPYLPRLMRECDVFIFLFGSSFIPRYLDYSLIKQAGKKIVATFWGSDIRYWYALEQESRQLGFQEEIEPFLEYLRSQKGNYYRCLRTVQAAEKYADLILSQQGYGQLQTRPYMRANVPIDLSAYACKIPARERPLILHAPSKRDIKGTPVVLEVIDALRQEGLSFDFRLIEGLPREEICAALADADIVVDQLYSETVGMLSTESMASGCATVTHYMNEYGHVPAECPAVNVNRHTLKTELRSLILDLPRRVAAASAGRPYVEKYYDHRKIASQILAWLEPGGIPAYDYHPSFYRTFNMPAGLLAQERKEDLRFWKS
jgi:hypothetical protein